MDRQEFWCKQYEVSRDTAYSMVYEKTGGDHLHSHAIETGVIAASSALADIALAEYDKRFTPETEGPPVYTITNPPKFEQLFDGVEFEGGVAYLQFQDNELSFVYTPQNMSPDAFYVPKQVNDKNYPVWWAHNASIWLEEIFSEIETGGMN